MKKILIFLVVASFSLILCYQLGLVEVLTDVTSLREWLASYGWWSYLIFIGLSVLVAVLMLPGQLLAIVGGLLYGGWLGGTLTIIGASLGCTVSFILAKYIARDYIVARFGHSEVFKKIEKGVRDNGVSFLIFTRLVPIFPYAIQSYAYALTPMSVSKFSIISFLTMMPASFIYAFMASEIVSKGVSFTLVWELAFAGVILSVLAIVPKKVLSKKIVYQEEKGSNS